jgi:hypothetical protein
MDKIDKRFQDYWLRLAGQGRSLPQETNSNWEKWVALPCRNYMLAPRQARAALEIIGYYASQGHRVDRLLIKLINSIENADTTETR